MEIKNLKIIPSSGKAENQFVGIKILDNSVEFHYPETYRLSSDVAGLRKDILSILGTISLAKTKTDELSEFNTQYNNDYVMPIGSFIWIINDYLTYGRYDNREDQYQKGIKGKIDWKRTMRYNPAISAGNVIYLEMVSKSKVQKDNLLTEIYNYCVQKAVDAIGWLYGIEINVVDCYQSFDKRLYLKEINQELLHTFDERKKSRLQNMKNIVTGLDDKSAKSKEIVYGVDSYEYVYEKMIDAMFSQVESIKDFYPKASWNLILENEPINSSNLRPDTVLIKDKKVFIIDAKYYRYGTTFKASDMPETTSIQKQITYGEYVKKEKAGEYDDVFSAFILPYSKDGNKHNERFNKDMEFVGFAEAKWKDSDGDSSKKILAILIDTKFLIDNWSAENKVNKNNIIQLIEKVRCC